MCGCFTPCEQPAVASAPSTRSCPASCSTASLAASSPPWRLRHLRTFRSQTVLVDHGFYFVRVVVRVGDCYPDLIRPQLQIRCRLLNIAIRCTEGLHDLPDVKTAASKASPASACPVAKDDARISVHAYAFSDVGESEHRNWEAELLRPYREFAQKLF